MTDTRLVPLGEGVYTVSEVCRILQPGMTPRKVHYWIKTGVLSDPPLTHRGKGTPTLLSFKQLLEIRTVQRLRDDLRLALKDVRRAFAWIRDNLFGETPTSVEFAYGSPRTVIAKTPEGDAIEVPTGQGALDIDVEETLEGVNALVETSRLAWTHRALDIPDHPHVIANARVMNGSPTIRGTRIETAIIAGFADADRVLDDDNFVRIRETYPTLPDEVIRDAAEFEGVVLLAS
jgi:uncharacterized protein (DUF433 family)/DNA-binding transcriptional MerR regulator